MFFVIFKILDLNKINNRLDNFVNINKYVCSYLFLSLPNNKLYSI